MELVGPGARDRGVAVPAPRLPRQRGERLDDPLAEHIRVEQRAVVHSHELVHPEDGSGWAGIIPPGIRSVDEVQVPGVDVDPEYRFEALDGPALAVPEVMRPRV